MTVPRNLNSAALRCPAGRPVAATSLPAASGAAAGRSSKGAPPRRLSAVSSALEICDFAQTTLDVSAPLLVVVTAAASVVAPFILLFCRL
jgi:hypothetical protein